MSDTPTNEITGEKEQEVLVEYTNYLKDHIRKAFNMSDWHEQTHGTPLTDVQVVNILEGEAVMVDGVLVEIAHHIITDSN